MADLEFLKGGSTARDRAEVLSRPHPVETRAYSDMRSRFIEVKHNTHRLKSWCTLKK